MNRIDVVRGLIRRLNATTYLEIGVFKGRTFLRVDCKRKIGVDPVNQMKFLRLFTVDRSLRLSLLSAWRALRQAAGLESVRFFEMSSDDFFRHAPRVFAEHKIDVAFIDGLHVYRQAFRDVLNCAQFLSPNGVIVMHDCSPATETMALPAQSHEEVAAMNVPGWGGCWCGDVWKAVVHLRTRTDLSVFVLDLDMGLGIITKDRNQNLLTVAPEQIDSMCYGDLQRNRVQLLDLKPAGYFDDFMNRMAGAGGKPQKGQ